MKSTYAKLAKTMLRASLKNGRVDETQGKLILTLVASRKPQGLLKILRLYKNLVDASQNREKVTIESAVKIKDVILKGIAAKTGAPKIAVTVNPQQIWGIRITHGDWVWDNTLEGKLKQLTIDS